MTDFEIIKHVENGANFYLKLSGDAQHMEYNDNGVYSYIMPKEGEQSKKHLIMVQKLLLLEL